MKWDDFINTPINSDDTKKTDIDCPKCGKKIYLDTKIVLATYPPTYSYWCDCGWHSMSHVMWSEGMI